MNKDKLERLRVGRWRTWNYSLLISSGELSSYACLLNCTFYLVFQLKSFNFLPYLQHLDGALMDPILNVYDKFQ